MGQVIPRKEIKEVADSIQDQLLTKLDWIDGASWAVKRMTKFIRWYTFQDFDSIARAYDRFKRWEEDNKK